MVEGCAPSCTKFVLILANVLVCILGAAVFGVSIWASFDPSFSDTLQGSLLNVTKDTTGLDLSGDVTTLSTMVWVLCGLGLFTLLVGLVGCWGAWAENRCCLSFYFCVVLLCALVQLGLAIAIMVWDWHQSGMESLVTDALNATKTADKVAFKQLESELNCCGVSGTEPECIAKMFGDQIRETLGMTTTLGRKPGCAQATWELISHGLVTLGIVCIAAVVVELLALVSACILCTAIGKRVGYTEFV